MLYSLTLWSPHNLGPVSAPVRFWSIPHTGDSPQLSLVYHAEMEKERRGTLRQLDRIILCLLNLRTEILSFSRNSFINL